MFTRTSGGAAMSVVAPVMATGVAYKDEGMQPSNAPTAITRAIFIASLLR
jgi:hypothetical protein